MTTLVVDSAEQARNELRSILPIGAEVFNNTSLTLETIGVAEDIERSGIYQPLRLRLYQMDRQMREREMRQVAAAPDFVVGRVHALTMTGRSSSRRRAGANSDRSYRALAMSFSSSAVRKS